MFSYRDAADHLGIQPRLLFPSEFAQGASADTRTLAKGDLFVAIQGEKRDGHDFLEEAFKLGASGALINLSALKKDPDRFFNRPNRFQNLLPVEDTLQALTELAGWCRKFHDIPVIGVTGSVGKTLTKDFLSYLLSCKSKGLSTRGNFNNHLGLPLTLLRLDRTDRFCVAELGANHQGEIRHLASILQPTSAIITRIAPAHLEGFGSLDAIYRTKLELFEQLPQGAWAVLPDDDPVLLEKAKKLPLRYLKVGFSGGADYRISEVENTGGFVRFEVNGKKKFAFKALAPFYAWNACMALAVIETLGYAMDSMPEVWENLNLADGRFQEFRLNGNIRVIYDGYNANPLAFEKALEAFDVLAVEGGKVLVIADMMELGADERRYHEQLGSQIARFKWNYVAAYGERVKYSIDRMRELAPHLAGSHFKNADEVADFLRGFIKPGDAVFLKGSRSMKVERILSQLQTAKAGEPDRETLQSVRIDGKE